MCTVLDLLCVLFSVMALNFPLIHVTLMNSLKMSYCYLAFRTNVLLNLCCPGHLSYYSPNESEPLIYVSKTNIKAYYICKKRWWNVSGGGILCTRQIVSIAKEQNDVFSCWQTCSI